MVRPRTLKIFVSAIVSAIVILTTGTATVVSYFNVQMSEMSKSKILLDFESQKLKLVEECSEKLDKIEKACGEEVERLKERLKESERRLDDLNIFIKFLTLDKTKMSLDEATKIRNKFFGEVE